VKYYIITGESSGDIHAANLVKYLMKQDTSAIVRGWGGKALKSLGVQVVKELNELNFMGLIEVLKHIKQIRNNFKFAYSDIKSFNPDVLILVDFPGFNLKIAKWAKINGYKVFYYISPTIWAWHKSRIKIIKHYVDKMFVILPFEKDFYQNNGVVVEYHGHPILDSLQVYLEKQVDYDEFCYENNLPQKPLIAILPGSREQEIKRLLPIMTAVSVFFDDFHFVIAGISEFNKSIYEKFCSNNVSVLYDKTYDLLKHSYAAIVKSGTSTLETAIFKVPQVVCYKLNNITYLIARLLVRNVKYISLVNLLLNKECVKELIQNNLTVDNLKNELNLILNTNKRKEIIADYENLINLLGNKGASERIAKRMISILNNFEK